MKQIAKDRVRIAYFKRWSRKKYAAFVSMRFNVIISFLKKGVVEASLFKVEKYVKRGEARHILFQPDREESKAPPNLPDAFINILLSLLFLNWGRVVACSLLGEGKLEWPGCDDSVLHDTYYKGIVSEKTRSLLFYLFIIYNHENK